MASVKNTNSSVISWASSVALLEYWNILEYRNKRETGYTVYAIYTMFVNRLPRNRLPRVIRNCTPKGRKTQGRPLKRLLYM
jgi:hypothetical protein